MTIILVGKANTLSQQLREIQKLGICNNGPDITDPATGLSYDLIRDILSGEFDGPLPVTSKPGWDGRKS